MKSTYNALADAKLRALAISGEWRRFWTTSVLVPNLFENYINANNHAEKYYILIFNALEATEEGGRGVICFAR